MAIRPETFKVARWGFLTYFLSMQAMFLHGLTLPGDSHLGKMVIGTVMLLTCGTLPMCAWLHTFTQLAPNATNDPKQDYPIYQVLSLKARWGLLPWLKTFLITLIGGFFHMLMVITLTQQLLGKGLHMFVVSWIFSYFSITAAKHILPRTTL